MEPFLVGVLGIVLLIVLLMLGVHVGVALAFTGFAGMVTLVGFERALMTATTGIYYQVSNYALVTIPLFILMGFLAAGGGVSQQLYDGLKYWFGRMRGGLGIATILGNAAFGTLTGSSIVAVTVFSKISAPEMRRHGYDKKLAYGICASAGAIGMLIPPSILMVLYGILGGLSIGDLLIAGIAPGLVLTMTLCAAILIVSRLRPDAMRDGGEQATWSQRLRSLIWFWPVFLIAGIIFGGIFGGVFNPTEAAAIAAFVMFIILFILRPRGALRHTASSLTETAKISAMVFMIFAGAEVFTRFMVLSGITTWLMDAILAMQLGNMALVLMFVVFYLVMGMFLTSISMLAITVPVLAPIVKNLGIDPIWFAMVVILAIHVGLITPPVGLNIFAAKSVAEPDVSLEDIFQGVFPFFIATLVALLIIIAFPSLTTMLPQLMNR